MGVFVLLLQAGTGFGQGTAFTYQGRLASGGIAASGTYDLQFNLFTDDGSILPPTAPVASAIISNSVFITNGLFTIALDFGANFSGADRWLEISVRTNGGGAFTTLTPRQKITPAPYAIAAGTVNGIVPPASLAGTYSGALTLTNATNSFAGAFAGNGAGLTNVAIAAWPNAATNVTFYEVVTTNSASTNVVYVTGAGTPLANGSYYLRGNQSGLTTWSNANGSGLWFVLDAPTAFANHPYQIMASLNGVLDDSAVLYHAENLGGPWTNDDGAIGLSPAPSRVGFGTYQRPFAAVGQPIFDGGNITNLNGAHLQTGSVSGSSFAAGAFNSIQGGISLTGELKATNVYANVSASTGMPIHGGEIWRNMPLPPIIFTTWWQCDLLPTESFCTNLIRLTADRGITAAFHAAGLKPYLEVDAGWKYLTRDANGDLWWNTNRFPHGLPWLADYCHTNGWLLELHQYFSDASQPTGGAVFDPVSTLMTANRDVQQFYRWRVDAIRLADGYGGQYASYQNQNIRAFADAVLYPGNMPASYTNKIGMALDAAFHDLFVADAPYQVNNYWTDQGICQGDALEKALCRARIGEHGSGEVNGSTAIHWMAGKGHYFNYQQWADGMEGGASLAQLRGAMAMACIFPAQLQFGFYTNWGPVFQSVFTNPAMLAIYADPLCLPGAALFDDGLISAWARPLAGGNFALALVNESGSSSNMVINWSQVASPADWAPVGSPLAEWRIPANMPCVVDSIWGQTNVGTFTGSFNFTVPAHSLEFFKLTPQPFSTAVLASGTLSAARATSGSVIQTVWVPPFTGTTNGAAGGWSNVLSGTITPKLSSSRIVVQVSSLLGGTAGSSVFARISRADSAVLAGDAAGARTSTQLHSKFLDSSQTSPMTLLASELPGSTSPLQYDFQVRADTGGAWCVNRDTADDDASAHPRAVTTMLIQEIAP